ERVRRGAIRFDGEDDDTSQTSLIQLSPNKVTVEVDRVGIKGYQFRDFRPIWHAGGKEADCNALRNTSVVREHDIGAPQYLAVRSHDVPGGDECESLGR